VNRLNTLWSRLTYFPHGRRFDDDLQEEIRFHIEARADELERSGMNRAEALATARRAFGSHLRMREQSRDPWRFRWLDDALLDLRYALRMLRRTPVFTLTALGTLALGIGANTAIFSIIDAAILRPLPYPNPDRLVEVYVQQRQQDRTVSVGPLGSVVQPAGHVVSLTPSLEDVRDWHAQSRVFSDVAICREGAPVVLDGGQPHRVNVASASEGCLGVFGVAPVLGRGISIDDTREGAPAVVLLGYGFWQSRFGGDRGVIGRTIRLENEPATIAGVLPASFHPESQILRPFRLAAKFSPLRGSGAPVYGRLREGVDVEQARRTLSALTSQLDRARGRSGDIAVRLDSLYERTVAGYGDTTKMFAAAVVLILLIACANVAGLLLARGTARRPELAIRASIGAGRARLVRQLLTESIVLAAAGGAAGVLLARVSLDTLVANIPMSLPSNSPVTLNPHVLAFAAVLSLATTFLFGLMPAVRLSAGVRVGDPLSHPAVRQGSVLSRRGCQTLIAVEIALAVVLASGAALMIRSFARLLAVDVGFDPASIVAMDVVPVSRDRATRERYYPALVRALRGLTSLQAVGATDGLPLAGGFLLVVRAAVNGEWMPVMAHQVLPGYFEAIGVPLRAGRLPSDADRTATPPVAVLSERSAGEMFGGTRTAVGRLFQASNITFQVVGVVGNVRHGPSAPPQSEAFLPFGSLLSRPLTIVVRPRPGAGPIGEQVRDVAQSLGTRVVVDRIVTGSDLYRHRVAEPRQRTVLLGVFGGVGLVLALVGVFGVTAYAVARRTREIGVRMALGAGPAAVVRGVLRDSLWPAAIGIVVGLGASVAATRVIASFLFETRPTDPGSLAAAAVALALAAFLAALIPARRAARVDPVTVLRAE